MITKNPGVKLGPKITKNTCKIRVSSKSINQNLFLKENFQYLNNKK